MGAIQDILNSWGDDTVRIIRDNLASTGTNASGETSQSLQSDLIGNSRLQVSGKAFIYVVETGRKAGKRPPVSSIIKWLETGKVPIEGSIESAAWAISKKIGEEGSSLFRKGGREDIITPAISDQRVDELIDQVANAAQEETVNVIENAIEKR